MRLSPEPKNTGHKMQAVQVSPDRAALCNADAVGSVHFAGTAPPRKPLLMCPLCPSSAFNDSAGIAINNWTIKMNY